MFYYKRLARVYKRLACVYKRLACVYKKRLAYMFTRSDWHMCLQEETSVFSLKEQQH
jgi:hypothetical protein